MLFPQGERGSPGSPGLPGQKGNTVRLIITGRHKHTLIHMHQVLHLCVVFLREPQDVQEPEESQ